jgi:predicted nucleic acid-binding protein
VFNKIGKHLMAIKDNKTEQHIIDTKDAKIAVHAINNRATMLTLDTIFFKFMNAVGIPIKTF